jgi:putative transposase
MNNTQVARLVAYVTGMVNQQLLLQNEYLAAENKILRAHLPARLRLTDAQRSTLAEIGKRLGRQALQQVARVAKPDTILAWYRKLIAQKFDGSKHRRYPGRPSVNREIIKLVLRMARENTGWGYDRIAGALAIRHRTRSQASATNELGRVHSVAHGCPSRHRFLYCRSSDLARIEDLLCPVLPASRDSTRHHRWHHQTSD